MLKDDIEKLIRLQEIDSEIRYYKTIIEELPAKKTQMEQSIEDVSKNLSYIKNEQKKIQLEKKERELELHSIEEDIKKLQKQLDGVKTNKEYTAVLSEIDNRKKKIGDMEDIILMLMEKEDKINEGLADIENKSAEMKREVEAKLSKEVEKMEEVKKLLEEKTPERKKIVAGISHTVYEIYEKIRIGKKDSIAICKMEGQSCSGCSMFVPVHLTEKIKAGKELVHCENCSRILY
ncbi:MAG: hypothetical protein GX554_01590 [Elusimicrobia bacterium]|nr:hypothetical protein [Elusimicrobiota bacterium]